MIAILLILTNLTWASCPLYTSADLDALARDAYYKEYLDHALDIRPSKRDEKWKEQLAFVVENYLKAQQKSLDLGLEQLKYLEELRKWPALQNNEFFLHQRKLLGLKILKKCFKEVTPKNICLKNLESFWHSHPKQQDLGLKLAHLVGKYAPKKDLWVFLKSIPKGELATFQCQEKVVRKALVKNIRLIMMGPKTLEQKEKAVRAIMSKDCWKHLSNDYKQIIASGDRTLREEAFWLLKWHNDLTGEHKDFLMTLVLLDNPIKGPLFNQAWAHMKILGQDYQRRKRVIDKLKSLDPLPANILARHEKRLKKTVLGHLGQHIPEYLDIYAKFCLDNGLGSLYNCKEFFRLSKGEKWPRQRLKVLFSKNSGLNQ